VFISSASDTRPRRRVCPLWSQRRCAKPVLRYFRGQDRICEDLLDAAVQRKAASRPRSCGPVAHLDKTLVPFDGRGSPCWAGATGQADRSARYGTHCGH